MPWQFKTFCACWHCGLLMVVVLMSPRLSLRRVVLYHRYDWSKDLIMNWVMFILQGFNSISVDTWLPVIPQVGLFQSPVLTIPLAFHFHFHLSLHATNTIHPSDHCSYRYSTSHNSSTSSWGVDQHWSGTSTSVGVCVDCGFQIPHDFQKNSWHESFE